MASKGGMNKTVFEAGSPKKTRQGKVLEHYSRQLLVMQNKRNIEDKERVK
jgi:hypothetical protein